MIKKINTQADIKLNTQAIKKLNTQAGKNNEHTGW